MSRFTYKDIPDFYQSWKHKQETPGKDVPKIQQFKNGARKYKSA